MSFRDFLEKRKKDRNPIGDLARDALDNKKNKTVDDVFMELIMCHACDGAWKAFRKVVNLYIKSGNP